MATGKGTLRKVLALEVLLARTWTGLSCSFYVCNHDPYRASGKTALTVDQPIKLPVPFYRQTSEFTCGPACLMMAMKFFQFDLRVTRDLEFDIWRESNLVESYGTSKEGLALAAARRGFEVYTMGKSLRHSFVDVIRDRIPSVNNRVLELLYNDTRRKFRAMGLKHSTRSIQLSAMKSILKESHVPILFTSTALFGEKEDPLPHWVVITGYEEKHWYLNNPMGTSAQTRVSHKQLLGNLGYRGVRCALVVSGRMKIQK